ncbi:PTS sugar transporter subunit IIB [Enterococcus durans]|uniref:PTS system, mannose/fructose/sorbose family, IIB component n=2 Tax=Enterococcus TaxID=1350 RepID=A0A377KLF6_9ENTE|nr:PTS sugar transporter subunit IIB [Enterococcus durans]MDB1653529.1 PTS sugar transporter subunit IIB [Enterococcus durans]MDB1656453.1 PTS sugar transporter subunit IIB [Enterococcus durans]MDB1663695.1 PTS sugar transporter subunit IIB [Enterococcus durans]MDB1670007.1 PTS sugar transporter subunit IIB [Enterococcus durans]MDB1672009.1 PTS sugar transporter subunit IIB [Enterococcus durans]
MKNIVFARVDDRLIHGEVVTAWTPTYSINHIIIIDDIVATDPFQKRVLKALAPTKIRVDAFTVVEGIKELGKDYNEKERVLLLTKSPIVYAKLVEGGIELPQVNLGGMGIRDERKPFIKNVACDEKEIEAIRNIVEKGIHVFYQLVPEQRLIEITNLL